MADNHDALFHELLKRAATQNAAMVDPAAASTRTPPTHGVNSVAKMLYAGGAGADIATTIGGFATGKMHEENPLINFAGDKAALPIGMGEEIGVYLLAKKLLGDRHPKLLNLLVGGAGAAHSAFAARNIQRIGKAGDVPEPVPGSVFQRTK